MLSIAYAAPSAARAQGRSGSGGTRSFFARVLAWAELRRQRQGLSQLSPEQLRDIGLDAEAAAAEASRPFWDAPANWR